MEKENFRSQIMRVLEKKKPKKKEKQKNTLPTHTKKKLVAGILWSAIGVTFFLVFFFIVRSGAVNVKQSRLSAEITALKEQVTQLQQSNAADDNLEVFTDAFINNWYGTEGIGAKDYSERIQPYFASGIEVPDIKNMSGSKTVESIQLWEKTTNGETISLEYLITYSYSPLIVVEVPEPEPEPEPEEPAAETEGEPEGEAGQEPETTPVAFIQQLTIAQTVPLSEKVTSTKTEIIHFEVKKSRGGYSVISYPYVRMAEGITAAEFQKPISGWNGKEQTSSTNKEDIAKWLTSTFFPRYFQSADLDDVKYIMREPVLLGNVQEVQGIKEIQVYDNDGNFLVKATVQVTDTQTNFLSLQEYTIELSKESDQKYFVEKITHTLGE